MKQSLLAFALVIWSLNVKAAGPEGYYCKARSLRVYQALSTVRDSTGNAVGHAGGRENGARVILIDDTHIVSEYSLQNSQNDSQGLFLALNVSQRESGRGHQVRRLNGSLTFDGGYAARIHALEIDGVAPTFFSLSLVKMADGRVSRILGRQGQDFSQGTMSASLYNLDVDNAWLGINSNYYEDRQFQRLATLIANQTVSDGAVVNVGVDCTPKK